MRDRCFINRRLVFAVLALLWGGQGQAATNSATNLTGGSHTLSTSGSVTVNSTALQLVKQVWIGGVCYASSPSDALCNGGATSVTVPAASVVKFMIYVQNASSIVLTDVRFQDLLDDNATTGFTYQPGTILSDASQTAAATAANIYTAVTSGTVQTDAVDAGGTNYVSIVDTGGAAALDRLSVGSTTTLAAPVQVNEVLSIAANKTFAIIFDAIKN